MPLLDFPPDMFELRPGETAMYGHDPMIQRYADHLKNAMGIEEWIVRRERVARFFYQSLVGELPITDTDGRSYDPQDQLSWYLFLAESINEHPQNYEVHYGSRVVPTFARLGKDLDQLVQIPGYEERLLRLIGPEKSQPNGGLFEFLVANAYASEGYEVAFHPETKGKKRSYDLDARKGGTELAIECKRMEGGEYHEKERERMRELWNPARALSIASGDSSLLEVNFEVELSAVPDEYLESIVRKFISSSRDNLLFKDDYANGIVRSLDLGPIQIALKDSSWLFPGPQYTEKLMGSYRRYDQYLMAQKVKHAPNPHFIDDIEQAAVARWTSLSTAAIDKKARDVRKKVADALDQLPVDTPGVIHIGLEALGGGEIEMKRRQKIEQSIQGFDARGKPLEAIICNLFAPEASPKDTWAIDETCLYYTTRPDKLPLKNLTLMLSDDTPSRNGVHWE